MSHRRRKRWFQDGFSGRGARARGRAGWFCAQFGRESAEAAAHAAVGVLAHEPGDASAQAVLGADGVADEAQGRLLVVGEFVAGLVGEELPQGLDMAEQGQEQGADPRLERGRMGARGAGGHGDMRAGIVTDRHGGGACGLEGGCEGHWWNI